MVEPRKPKDIKRIVSRAKGKSTEAGLAEYDSLLSARFARDPSVPLSAEEKRKKLSDERRLRSLGRRLFRTSRHK